jgi:hypothetical protein
MLNRLDLRPHFDVADLDGTRLNYASIWQQKILVLVVLPDGGASSRHYAGACYAKARELNDRDTAWIVTAEPVEGLPAPGVAVADQWGEIAHVVRAARIEDLPDPEELADWVRHVRHRCPECEGEAK